MKEGMETGDITAVETDPVIETYKQDIDRGILCENLRLTVEQRFEELMMLQQFAEALQSAGMKASRTP